MKKETRNLILFFLFTFAWTWAFYAPMAFGGHNPYEMPWLILLILGGMGPSLVGVAMVLLTCNREQRRDYWIRCFSLRRIGIRWWLIIFLIFPAIYGLSIAIDVAMGGQLPGMEMLRNLIANPLTIPLAAFISFMSGPWSEEFGWRGFALDRIIKPLGVIPGTIVLGVVWGVWHLPLYFMSNTWHGDMGFQLAGFWTFVLFNVGLSLIMTWVYLNTSLSILSGMLLHFTSNFTSQLIAPSSDRFEVVRMILLLAFGLAACAVMLRNRQTHPALGQVKPARP
jgi:membrane protease YdiL (CAAX protease family)